MTPYISEVDSHIVCRNYIDMEYEQIGSDERAKTD